MVVEFITRLDSEPEVFSQLLKKAMSDIKGSKESQICFSEFKSLGTSRNKLKVGKHWRRILNSLELYE